MDKKNLKATLHRRIKYTERSELNRNLKLAKLISVAIAVLGLVIMVPLSFKQNNMTMVICSAVYGTMALFVYVYTNIRKDLKGFNLITIVMTYFLIFQYLLNGGNEGFGLTWILIFPLLYLYMLGTKFFIALTIGNILIIALGFFTPLSQYIYDGWNMAYKIRFTLVLLIESIISIAFKISSASTDSDRREIFDNLLELQKTLQEKVKARTQELLNEKDRSDKFMLELAMSLSATIDAKDKYTSGHSRRVAEYSKEIASRLGKDEKEQQKIYLIALLHDIGKIGIPDEIINKKSQLTDEEYNIVKQHPEIGSDILKNIESIPEIKTGVRWHHERYDGKGYPDGLKGNDIPEYAQIVAVADSYDAMTSNRSYRKLLPQSVVRSEIEKGKNMQFAPQMADIMLNIIDNDTNYTLHE